MLVKYSRSKPHFHRIEEPLHEIDERQYTQKVRAERVEVVDRTDKEETVRVGFVMRDQHEDAAGHYERRWPNMRLFCRKNMCSVWLSGSWACKIS